MAVTGVMFPIYQGNKIRLRPMENVVEEIRALSGGEFYVTDDMIMLNRPRIQRYVMELCEKIKDFGVNMFLSCSPAMNTDPAFLDAIAAAGTKSMYTVFASDPFSSRFFARHPGIWQRTIDLVKQLEDRGIRFFGSFGVGFDSCGADQFDLILEFCEKAGVKTAEFFIATPFPNTPFWHTIANENRFIETDWKKFNCANVVFKPKHTTEQQLRDGFVMLWREFFKSIDHENSLSTFHQKLDNILKSREYSQEVKDAVARGLQNKGLPPEVRFGHIRETGGIVSKKAIVTGGSRGIGAAIVETLASEGFEVAFSYISRKEKADELIAENYRQWR